MQLDKKGFINKRQLNKYQGDSRNVANLKELVNSKSTIHVTLTDDPINVTDKMGKQNSVEMFYQGQMEDFKDPNFEYTSGNVNGDVGMGGLALLPGNYSETISPNNNIYLYINKIFSKLSQSEVFCDESAHALIFLRTGDRSKSSHQQVPGLGETNTMLRNIIIESRKETVKKQQ